MAKLTHSSLTPADHGEAAARGEYRVTPGESLYQAWEGDQFLDAIGIIRRVAALNIAAEMATVANDATRVIGDARDFMSAYDGGCVPTATLTDRAEAVDYMKACNRHLRGKSRFAVMVEGPECGEWTVMDIAEAIDAGFLYTWEV
jgi:hypothetical protein